VSDYINIINRHVNAHADGAKRMASCSERAAKQNSGVQLLHWCTWMSTAGNKGNDLVCTTGGAGITMAIQRHSLAASHSLSPSWWCPSLTTYLLKKLGQEGLSRCSPLSQMRLDSWWGSDVFSLHHSLHPDHPAAPQAVASKPS